LFAVRFPLMMFRLTDRGLLGLSVLNLAQEIGRDGLSSGQQGRFTLMAIFRTPNVKPVDEAQTLQPRTPRRGVLRLPRSGVNRRRKVTLIEVGLFVLVVSTAMAIASISLWWIPVYLVAVVVIFVAPAKRRAASTVSESDVESDADCIVAQDSSLRVDCAHGPDEIRSVSQLDSDLANVDPTGSMDSNPDLTVAGATKRRGRVRARKVTSPVNGPVTDCRPVAWVQVGPGKFVRVEGGIQGADPVQVEEVTPRVNPISETLAEAPPSAQAEAEPLMELEPFASPGTFPSEAGLISISDDCVSESVTEEYGIAPSAFSPAMGDNSSVEAAVDDLTGDLDESDEVETTAPGEPGNSRLPGAQDHGPFLCQRRMSRSWVRRIQRGTTHAVPRVDRVSRRSVALQSASPRLLVGSRHGPSMSRRKAVVCAVRRMLPVWRPIRTRSPPCR